MQGLVNTIVPVYNRAGLLREAVAIVREWTYRATEVNIVEGSTVYKTRCAGGTQAAEY